MYDLRSSATITNDLAQAVRALGDELATQDSPAFHLVVEGPTRDLHPIIRDELYRITREALRNAFSHAAAHHIEAEITYGDGHSGCASGTTERVFRPTCWKRAVPATMAFQECGNALSRSAPSWKSGVAPRPVRKLN